MKKKDVAPGGKYPWNRWFSKKEFTLRIDQYGCMPHCMAVQIRNQARKRKLRVSIETSVIGTLFVKVLPLWKKRKGKK